MVGPSGYRHFQDIVATQRRHRRANWVFLLGQLSYHAQIAACGIDTKITDPLMRVDPRSCPHLPILIHQSSSEKVQF